jgi:hypothetical protein
MHNYQESHKNIQVLIDEAAKTVEGTSSSSIIAARVIRQNLYSTTDLSDKSTTPHRQLLCISRPVVFYQN